MSKGAVILVLLSLLLISLTSCRLTKSERRLKKDSELLEKIKGRSPELFASRSDTVRTTDSIKGGVDLVEDTARIRELLRQYHDLEEAKEANHENRYLDIEQRGLRHQMLHSRQRDIATDVIRAGFKKKEAVFKGRSHDLKVTFDPNSKDEITLSGTVDKTIITNETTITVQKYIFKKPTTIQAIKKLWPYFLVATLICIGAIIKFIIG